MQPFESLEKIEKTSGKIAKAALLTSASSDQRMQDLLNAAFNFKRKFRMKKFACNPSAGTAKELHPEFVAILTKLEKQTGRTAEAVAEVEAFLKKCTPIQAKWYTRVLQQDLKAGFSVDTAISTGYKIPKFEVQLAKDGAVCKRLLELLKLGCVASRKYDGFRCIAVIDHGDVTLYSRNGEAYQNFPTIQNTLSELFPDEKVVLDGEIMSDDFNSMQRTAFAAKRGTTVGDVVYHVFDRIDYKEWDTDTFVELHSSRIKKLKAMFAKNKPDNIALVQHTPVISLEEILALEKQYIEEHYEGVMVNPDCAYYRGRKSNAMLKFKTFVSWDCKVTGFYIGSSGTKNAKRLGGFIVLQENGKTCEVGSGFTDEERDYIWAHQDEFLDTTVEVQYQELTPDGKMRFPTKHRYRGDKDEVIK